MTDTQIAESSTQFLLDGVSPEVRKLLITERVRAMTGRVEEALHSLERAIVADDCQRDALVLGLLRAELLHLQLLHSDALSVMESVVIPRLPILTAAERFGVEQNMTDLRLYSPGRGIDRFYDIVDQKRLLNFEWLDYRDLFSASTNAERGKHFETLPILWQQHRRAYLHGCWLVQRWTNQFLAKECVHLKEWEDATHHAVLANDDALLINIAEGILSSRRAELVNRVVSRLLATANLRTHFVVACKLLRALEDAIPDDWIVKVGAWVLLRAQEQRFGLVGANHVSEAWETITSIARRFPTELARSTIALAVAHPAWTTKLDDPNRVIPERQEIVRALVPLTWVVNADDIPPLAAATLPLLTDRPQISDHNDVVNLLCNLAKRGGSTVRESMATALYPSGKLVSRVLAQVADVFGMGELFDSVRLQGLATQVAQEIRLQVQWLTPDRPATPVAEQIMEYSSTKDDRTLKVYVVGLTGLHALARHRTKLGEPTLRILVEALLDLAQNRDNFCINRAALLRALSEFADVIPETVRAKAYDVLEALACGPVEESLEYSNAEQTDNPLNPFKHHSGRPEDVQSMALVALATIASCDSNETKRTVDILEDAICDPRPEIRRAGYAAAGRLLNVSEGVILGVLAGLRDPDPNAAISAFAAFAKQSGWKLTRNHWRVFLMAVRFAQRTGSPKLRRHAAAALVAWSSRCPKQFAAEQTGVLEALHEDICWSVRSASTCVCDAPG